MQNYIIREAHFSFNWPALLYDRPWEHFTQADLEIYFQDGCDIFFRRFEEFMDLQRPLSPKQEYELEFMLSSLIHARRSLSDK